MTGVFTDAWFTISRIGEPWVGQSLHSLQTPQGVKPPESTENEKHDSSSGGGDQWVQESPDTCIHPPSTYILRLKPTPQVPAVSPGRLGPGILSAPSQLSPRQAFHTHLPCQSIFYYHYTLASPGIGAGVGMQSRTKGAEFSVTCSWSCTPSTSLPKAETSSKGCHPQSIPKNHVCVRAHASGRGALSPPHVSLSPLRKPHSIQETEW